MNATILRTNQKAGRDNGFTLVEVVVSIGILGILLGAIITGMLQSAEQAEWAGYSLAANNLASQGIEQGRAAKWDPQANPPVDNLVPSQFPTRILILDVPVRGTNVVYATNVTTINTVSANPPLKSIRVDCSWAFVTARRSRIFTNTVITLRAPDQ